MSISEGFFLAFSLTNTNKAKTKNIRSSFGAEKMLGGNAYQWCGHGRSKQLGNYPCPSKESYTSNISSLLGFGLCLAFPHGCLSTPWYLQYLVAWRKGCEPKPCKGMRKWSFGSALLKLFSLNDFLSHHLGHPQSFFIFYFFIFFLGSCFGLVFEWACSHI